jgi:hypothetical protein
LALYFSAVTLLTILLSNCSAIDEAALASGSRTNEWGNWLTVGTTVTDINTLQLKLCIYQDNPVVFYKNGTAIDSKVYQNETWVNLPSITPTSTYTTFQCSGDTSQLILAAELASNSGINVYRYNGASWSEDSPQPVSSVTVNDLTLSNDGSLLAYTDASSNPQTSKVLKYAGSSWQDLGSVSSSSICYDNAITNFSSKPYHICRNESTSGTLKVSNYGTSWTESAGLTTARASAIRIQSDGSTAYVSYLLAVGASNRLVSAKINGDNSLTDLSMPSIIDLPAFATSMDTSASLWVAFPASGDGDKLAISTYQSNQWIYKGISLSSTAVSVFDIKHSSTYTYLAYADSLNGGKVLVKRYTE